MQIPFLGDAKFSPKSAPWVAVTVVLGFVAVSLGMLLSDASRDDVLALYRGVDGKRFTNADVGSFFEVSTDNVAGPLCEATFVSKELVPHTTKDIVVTNKLGKSLPVLTGLMASLIPTGEDIPTAVEHSVTLRVTEFSTSFESLGRYTREVLNSMNRCGQLIEERTKNRNVRICPVHRVWKDQNGHTVALFFDPVAINGCRDDGAKCSSNCPHFDDGQFWTTVKTRLDLLEFQESIGPTENAGITSAGRATSAML